MKVLVYLFILINLIRLTASDATWRCYVIIINKYLLHNWINGVSRVPISFQFISSVCA